MIQFFLSQSPVFQALIAGCFTWGITAAGASLVFLVRTVNQRLLDGMMGFAAGVMIAASVWSLLIPSIGMAEEAGGFPWVPAATGFAAGWIFLWVLDRGIPHLHIGFPVEKAEGPKSSFHQYHPSRNRNHAPQHSRGPRHRCCVRRCCGRVAFCRSCWCPCAHHRYRDPEFSRGARYIHAVTAGRAVKTEKFLVRSAFQRLWNLTCCRSSRRACYAAPSPVCTCVCGRCNVLRSGRGGDPRVPVNGNEGSATLGFLIGFLVMMILDVALG